MKRGKERLEEMFGKREASSILEIIKNAESLQNHPVAESKSRLESTKLEVVKFSKQRILN